jgi:hypothetical protein
MMLYKRFRFYNMTAETYLNSLSSGTYPFTLQDVDSW